MNKFDFFEVVKIKPNFGKHNELLGKEGVILGMVKSDDGTNVWWYLVDFDKDSLDPDSTSLDLPESSIESTGKFAKREDYYPGDSIRVTVNEKGEGKLE